MTELAIDRRGCFSGYLRYIMLTCVCVALLSPRALPAQAPQSVSAEQVRTAIERAVRRLKMAQSSEGLWPDQRNYEGGLTPLCTLALLHAGCSVEEPELKLALAQVRKTVHRNTYGISLQTMVFCRVDPVAYRALIARNVVLLSERQVTEGEQAGMWSKPSSHSLDHIDNSMTHFAMLALYEAERSGVPVDSGIWKLALDYWERVQNPDGSWGWGPGSPGSGSMTCAGIAALAIASGQLGNADASIEGTEIHCCGQQSTRASHVRALSWLERNFLISRNPGWDFWHSYYLYSLERAGRLTGRRFFGKHDWYREGAARLITTQTRDGSWFNDLEADHSPDDLVSTAFSLMFLAKAQRPIVISQLQHLPKDDWNRHRHGLFNLVGHVESFWKQELTHQIVDGRAASVEDLLESPILFIHGQETPQFSADEKLKLRQYVERGGSIFAEQCCSGTFDSGFRQLMQEIFPEPDSQLRQLPPEHPVWFAEKPVKPHAGRELWGVEFGCRTAVIYAPQNLSCYWELDRIGREHELPKTVLPAIQQARWLGANVLAYATDRRVQLRSPTLVDATSRPAEPPLRGQLQIARVLHIGECDVAAGALRQILRIAADDFGLPPASKPPAIRLSDPTLFQYPMLAFSGRSDFRLTAAEQNQLRLYLERGGKIFSDSIASSPQFTKALKRELKLVLPQHSFSRIPVTHALYSDTFGGTDISKVRLRKVEPTTDGRPLKSAFEVGGAVLEGIRMGDRYAVIFSPYDISCTVDSNFLASFEGYEQSDAIRIAINVLCYMIQN